MLIEVVATELVAVEKVIPSRGGCGGGAGAGGAGHQTNRNDSKTTFINSNRNCRE